VILRVAWGVARHEVAVWIRSPAAMCAALLPALGLGALVYVLTVTIGMQPVALVQEGQGPTADHMAHLFEADTEAYLLSRMDREEAGRALWDQRVAAVIVIPVDFEERMGSANAQVELFLNNIVDVDLADDIRRAVSRSLAELDAPQLGFVGQRRAGRATLPNPFRVAIAEELLRETDTSFASYQMVPIVVLIVLSLGVLGTGMMVARDFERRTAKFLFLSPARGGAIIAGKLLGGLLTTALLLAPVLGAAFGIGALSVPAGHGPALALILFLLVAMSVGMGLLLGLLVRKTRLAAMVGLNASAYLFFLGGGFTTTAFLPRWLETASRLVPTSYAIRALRQALFYPDLVGFQRDAAILAGAALLFAMAGVWALLRAWRTA
jgi:ABC-2 type transport system permease protein